MTRKILYLAALLITSIATNVPAQVTINKPIRVPGSTSSARFSPEKPKMNAENYLGYFKPLSVMMFGNSVQFSGSKNILDSSLLVSFKPPAAGKYSLDLSVRKSGATTFTVFPLNGKNSITQSFPQINEEVMRLTFVVNFAETSRQVIYIFADQAWDFFDCEISQIK